MQYEYLTTLDWVRSALDSKDKASKWQRWHDTFEEPSELLDDLQVLPKGEAFQQASMPAFSFMFRIPFRLRKPYISKDDAIFHILDNPVKKEWVFKKPYVAASQWKGALRSALRHRGFADDRAIILRLFGSQRGDESKRSGRLCFFPTFFDSITLEIINPHDRKTGIGTQRGPILMEAVPAGAKGVFTLLYIPFDLIGQDKDEIKQQALADLQCVAEGLQAMFITYGFGAKTSSGFGVAQNRLSGKGELLLGAEIPDAPAKSTSATEDNRRKQLQADIAQFVERFGLEKFPRWTNDELAASGWGKKRQSEYKRLRKRHPDWDEETPSWRAENENTDAEPAAPSPPPVARRAFTSLDELPALAKTIADQLQ